MAAKSSDPQLPESFRALLKDPDRPISAEDVATYGKLREIEDRSHRLRAIVKAWRISKPKTANSVEKMFHLLMIAMAIQAVFINIAFLLIGFGLLVVEPWTARTFMMAVFAEMAAIGCLVVKYLSPLPGDAIFKYLDERKPKTR